MKKPNDLKQQQNAKDEYVQQPANGNRYRKGKKPRKGKQNKFQTAYSEQSKTGKQEYRAKGFNDVSWYSKNPEMLRDSASYSYNSPVGIHYTLPFRLGTDPEHYAPFNLASQIYMAQETPTSHNVVPSVCAISIIPGPGKTRGGYTAANLAAQNIYSYVRYMNSGAKNYDMASLLLYLLSMDSIYSMWNWLKRIYGYLRDYSQYNRSIPMAFAAADGIDLNSFIDNLADFRMRLNNAAARISSFCVPAVMPIFLRHSWMYSNIYKDSNSEKAQMYMFTPALFYKYNETPTVELTDMMIPVLARIEGQQGKRTMSDLFSHLDDMIYAVAYSEDVGIMSGDILKAYGQDKLFKLSPVDPDYTVLPVYNEEVLNQIHNLTIVPVHQTDVNQFKMGQNTVTGNLIWLDNPIDVYQAALAPQKYIVNMPWDNVTPENTMVATRLMTGWTPVHQNKTQPYTQARIETCGTEIVSKLVIYFMLADGNISSYGTNYQNQVIFGGYNKTLFDNESRIVAVLEHNINQTLFTNLLTNFDWHPLIACYVARCFKLPEPMDGQIEEGLNFTFLGYFGDLNNYTFLDVDNLIALNETAVMSEFNVPQIGSF